MLQGTSGIMNKKDPVNKMDNKENNNNSVASATPQIRGPMDSYLLPQKKSSSIAGKCLTTSDNSFNMKYVGTKQKMDPGM